MNATVKQIMIGAASAVLAAYVLNWLQKNRNRPPQDAPPPAAQSNTDKHWWEAW